MEDKEIKPLEIITVGGTWKTTVNFVPDSGSFTITGVTHKLMAKDSTSDVSSSYVTGSPSYSGSQVTTGEVGTGSIPPGKYTYFLTVSYSAGSFVAYQDLEFVAMKGH